MTIRQSRYILAETDQERRVRVTEVQRAEEDPFIRKSEIQQTVNNSTLPVSSRAVNLAIESINSDLDIKADKAELEGLATEEYVNKKIEDIPQSSVNVVQATGNSTTDVMSQKAVSDELVKKIEPQKIGLGSMISPIFGESIINDIPSNSFYTVNNAASDFPSWKASGDTLLKVGSGAANFSAMLFGQTSRRVGVFTKSFGTNRGWFELYSNINASPDANGYLNTSKNPISTLTVSDMADTVVDNDLLTVTSGAVFRAIKQLTDQITSLEARVRELEDGGV